MSDNPEFCYATNLEEKTSSLNKMEQEEDLDCKILFEKIVTYKNVGLKSCSVVLERLDVKKHLTNNEISKGAAIKLLSKSTKITNSYVLLEKIYLKDIINKEGKLIQCWVKRGNLNNKSNKYVLKKFRNGKRFHTQVLDIKVLMGIESDYSYYILKNIIDEKHYLCPACSKWMFKEADLYYHICFGKKRYGYMCQICEQILESPNKLIEHYPTVHFIKFDVYNNGLVPICTKK